ncbi:MAG: hypothetical protein KGO81_12570 [Bacteroidota bacterium]|nr:hypothetical protein [Bacteroidota bacterium]
MRKMRNKQNDAVCDATGDAIKTLACNKNKKAAITAAFRIWDFMANASRR